MAIKLKPSTILKILGKGGFAKFVSYRSAGKVIWCNFELAKDLGFDPPRANVMTSEFQKQLVNVLSYRALKIKDRVNGRHSITVYADRYGGSGLAGCLGAGRAGFLHYGNIYIKGIGHTPLFRHSDPDDFEHSHGSAPIIEGMIEAVWGEVNTNLFIKGSTRVLAIIDQDEYVIWPNGRKEPQSVIARVGAQLRPAHVLAKRGKSQYSKLKVFINLTKATGQLVFQHKHVKNKEIPDLRATMLKIINDHARSSAEQIRWRITHGTLSPSNMEISGALLDLATQSSQPRTAPTRILRSADAPDSAFYKEHIDRAINLSNVYQSLIRSLPGSKRKFLRATPIDFTDEMNKAYIKYLELELLASVGLKTEVAEKIQKDYSELTRQFAELLISIAKLRNPGNVLANRVIVSEVSVVDIFNLLQNYPKSFFDVPEANQTKAIYKYLKPVFKGNKYLITYNRSKLKKLTMAFQGTYQSLMNICRTFARGYYGSIANLQISIKSRAAFENKPMDLLYRAKHIKTFNDAIARYKQTGDPHDIQKIIENCIAASVRRIDALLAQGSSRNLGNNAYEIEIRSINGVNYSIRAWNNPSQKRRLNVSITVQLKEDIYITSLPTNPFLTRQQIRRLKYRYSIDGWRTSFDETGRLLCEDQGAMKIFFDIKTFPYTVGRLEGLFYVSGDSELRMKDGVYNFNGYSFAVPDKQELQKLIAITRSKNEI